MAPRKQDADVARDAVLALLAERVAGATICPSEAARRIAAAEDDGDWRVRMPAVHAAVDELMAAGRVRLSWKGADMAVRQGPYRIAGDRGPIRSQRLP